MKAMNVLPYSLSELELEEIKQEEIKQEIDRNKVPRGINIRVRDYKDNVWKERKFVCKAENQSTPFVIFTDNKHFVDEIKDEWLKGV